VSAFEELLKQYRGEVNVAATNFFAPLTDAAVIDNWARAWQQLGRPAPHRLSELNAAWGASFRHYHDLRHLRECLGLLELWKGQGERTAEVGVALWFHDGVFDPGAIDNELRSAAWAARALGEARVSSEVAQRVYDLVMATQHAAHAAPVDGIDARLLLDIDLAILGAPPERFAGYEQDIRKEYAAVPSAVYRAGRRAVLQRFVAQGHIYHTAQARERLEAQARLNLRGALERLAQ
jgi:predicted metal-dependent HD superfamily phosphohydrolase